MPGQVVDYLPEENLLDIRNLREFAGMLALDKWTCNVNGRQAVFVKRPRERRYAATFVDQGYCFHAGEWKFVDAPLRGVYALNLVYREVRGWESFEPWLSRIENFAPEKAWAIARRFLLSGMEEIRPSWKCWWRNCLREKCTSGNILRCFGKVQGIHFQNGWDGRKGSGRRGGGWKDGAG